MRSSRNAQIGGAGAVPAQMWQGRAPFFRPIGSRRRTQGVRAPGDDRRQAPGLDRRALLQDRPRVLEEADVEHRQLQLDVSEVPHASCELLA